METEKEESDIGVKHRRRDGGDETPLVSVEKIFEGKEIPTWRQQVTIRSLLVSCAIGTCLSFIVMKLNLTTGIIPSLNVSAGLLGFFLLKLYTKTIEKFGLLRQPFTRQENTVIQTCVVACAGIAFSGGFGSYMLGMSPVVANQQPDGTLGSSLNTKELSLGWMMGFLFLVSFVGLFSVVPLRKIMIVQYKLRYPSGTATAHLINSFHTPQGAKIAKKQVSMLFKSFGASFFWAFFQWFFTGGDNCGFASFPSLGIKAYEQRFYFDFSTTYIGVGMICPYIINFSLLLGSIISWGILWPVIESKKGSWYPADIAGTDLKGLQGYKVFISIAIIVGDGLYHFLEVLLRSSYDIYTKLNHKEPIIPIADRKSPEAEAVDFDEIRRNQYFLKDQIPMWVAVVGYLVLAAISVIFVPMIFPQLKHYHIVTVYAIAPPLAFCNAYGCGLTDWSLASNYGKLAIFIYGTWVGMESGGILAGLAACGIMMSIVSTASDLVQDFKTGYLTLTSPRSMFVSQVIGTAMGCIIAPCVFWSFYHTSSAGTAGSTYPAPFALLYRGIAVIGVQGFSALPSHCLSFCLVAFILAFGINLLRECFTQKGWTRAQKIVPSAMGMAVPFYLGGYFTIDMCMGSVILFLWERANKRHANAFAPALASGLICGDGIWSLPASLLSLFKIKPPVCMAFFSRADYAKATAALGG